MACWITQGWLSAHHPSLPIYTIKAISGLHSHMEKELVIFCPAKSVVLSQSSAENQQTLGQQEEPHRPSRWGRPTAVRPCPGPQTTCCASWLRAAHAQKPPAICKTVSEQTVHAVTEIVHCISPRFSNPGSHPHYQRIMVTDLDGQDEQPLPLPMRTWRPAHQGVSGSAGLRRQRTPLPLLVNPNSRSGSLHP